MTFDDLSRPPLDRLALSAALTREGSLWRSVEVLDRSPSTNAYVADRARRGEPAGLVVVAEHQTAGRGRLDRVWTTPARAALTFSFLVRPHRVPAGRWPWLPLLTGIAVAEGVQRVTGIGCSLKWPNDVLVGERKLAGILVERVEAGDGAQAVIGVGLNVSTSAEELPVGSATSLALEAGSTIDRSVILRAVLRTFEALYLRWQLESGDPAGGLLDSYVLRCATLGRNVRVDLPGGEQVLGEATGIDDAGRLLLSTSQGVIRMGAGDVVHVRASPS